MNFTTKAYSGRYDWITQALIKTQDSCFDKNLEAHWNLGIIIRK